MRESRSDLTSVQTRAPAWVKEPDLDLRILRSFGRSSVGILHSAVRGLRMTRSSLAPPAVGCWSTRDERISPPARSFGNGDGNGNDNGNVNGNVNGDVNGM